MELMGKTALITGSASGLGKRVALMLAAQGANIVLNYNSSKREALDLQERLERMGVRAAAVQGDIASAEGAEKLSDEALAWSGGIDILINNAGPFVRERLLFADYETAEIARLVNGNLLGAMLLDRRVLPEMRRRRWGRIIHFGFGHAGEARAWPHRAVYAAAKTGLVSFTKSLAAEEAPNGITVNMIGPGDIRGLHKEQGIDDVAAAGLEGSAGRPGTGEDIARVVLFLCGMRSDFITGSVIDVTGGYDPIRPNIHEAANQALFRPR
ncbi:SDR family oxidoreductase [Paenibacillus thailandensis]|uniref:SDR family oxidoreductase n=1 Tax=Paenibacillus thailandensis TaxID=393250 RepID=A0ABW5QT04_9BACL